MIAKRDLAHAEDGHEQRRNWVLIGLVGLSLEFWIVVTSALAHSL